MNNKKFIFPLLGFLFLFNILAWLAVYDLYQSRFFEVDFFDVGQGDAVFVETPWNHQILIDGGPDSTILEKVAKNLPFWDNDLDLIILTHPEEDHLTGLIEVLKRYKVENILWTGVVRDTAEYKEWERLIEKEKAKIFIAQADQKIEIQESDFNILYPFENLAGEVVKDSNNTSIIIRLTFGENSFLLTGDAHKSIEKNLLDNNTNLESDILKVAHHGSKSSNSEDFIAKVSPEIAVISVGKNNRYGHPAQEVLDTLNKYGIRILRTDKDGDVKIISDGKNYASENVSR